LFILYALLFVLRARFHNKIMKIIAGDIAFFILYLLQHGLPPAVVGLVFVACTAMYAITTPMWGMLVDKKVGNLAVKFNL
jgi:Na+/melibiose symporter-like transporter